MLPSPMTLIASISTRKLRPAGSTQLKLQYQLENISIVKNRPLRRLQMRIVSMNRRQRQDSKTVSFKINSGYPGIQKLKRLIDADFFGRIIAVRGEFGYWVFQGDAIPTQRPSWNYRTEDGGGIILDMFSHWRYVIDNLFGAVKGVSCIASTHLPKRWDEEGKPYTVYG